MFVPTGLPRCRMTITPDAPDHASASRAWEHFSSVGSPRYICAPMVDGSELAFRQLVRRYGVQLAYTPMLHSANFVRCPKFRREHFTTCAGDRPLVAQFCGNQPEVVLQAARYVEDQVDAVDLNLGCPQHIARRGHYGAFLQDDWELVARIVRTLRDGCRVPVWCKIRVFDDVPRTLQYAQMLQEAGCSVLAVHGRTREQKGQTPGPANWDTIRAIKQHLRIPVLMNGNVQSWADVQRGLAETGTDGVLSADRLLAYPALFSGREGIPVRQLAHEYLECVRSYDPSTSPKIIRSHLFRLFQDEARVNVQLRDGLLDAQTVDAFERLLHAAKPADAEAALDSKDREASLPAPRR